MNNDNESVKMTIVVPRWMRDAAIARAKRTDTSVSRKVRECLRAWLAEPEDEPLAG